MEILCASSNINKIKEIKNILGQYDVNVIGLSDIGYKDEIIEDGETFEENALIKVRALSKVYHGLIIADDSGLCVSALNNEPGVYSARFLGEATSYEVKNTAIIDALKTKHDRSAAFVCAIAMFYQGKESVVVARCEGTIAHRILGHSGFGYDPIFVPAGYEMSFGQLSAEIKDSISHRAKALKLIKPLIEEAIL